MLDPNLSGLGKTLRMLGLYSVWPNEDEDPDELIKKCHREKGVVLTRSRRIFERVRMLGSSDFDLL